jgi:hypothetical protein
MGIGILDFLRSPLGGGLIDLGRGIQGDAAWQKWYEENVVPANAFALSGVAGLGQPGNTTQFARDIYGRAQGLGAQYSDQDVQDVNKRYDQLGAAGQMRLSERGLTGSTIGPSVAYANERNRGAELRSTNDARLNRLLGIESTFGLGGVIGADQAAANARLGYLQGMVMTPPAGPRPLQLPGQFKPP